MKNARLAQLAAGGLEADRLIVEALAERLRGVELLELSRDDASAWWATVRPSRSPTATARRVPLTGLALLPLPLPAMRAA